MRCRWLPLRRRSHAALHGMRYGLMRRNANARARAHTRARIHACVRTLTHVCTHVDCIAHLRGPSSLPHAGAAAAWPALDHTARRTRVVARVPHEPRERLGERELGSRPPMQRAVNRYAPPLTNDAAAHLPRGAWARGGGRRSGRAESGVPMWRGREPSPSADVGSGDPSPGATVGGGGPGPGAEVAGASPVPAQMWLAALREQKHVDPGRPDRRAIELNERAAQRAAAAGSPPRHADPAFAILNRSSPAAPVHGTADGIPCRDRP